MADIKTAKQQKKEYIAAVGRRREAVARVRLYAEIKADAKWGDIPFKKGEIIVNEKLASDYFFGDVMRHMYTEPFRIVNAQNKYAVTVRVTGGGPSGQIQAMVHAIANALSKADPENYRLPLKQKGFLTRDPRIRERRKVGMGGKSRRKKQSPKR